MRFLFEVEIISAPSVLGLKPTGVEDLAEALLRSGLAESLGSPYPVTYVSTLNDLYSYKRDPKNHCLNPEPIRNFSIDLGNAVSSAIEEGHFPVVLGGDCSLLIGIMSVLKAKGIYGLIFLDAHGDFYEPEKSITGEVADMDLAIVTGRGPEILTNINNCRPFVRDEDVVHIGQRDWEETREYGSRDIRETAIKCIPFSQIREEGMETIIAGIQRHIKRLAVEGYWIHFDADVLEDAINPAVDYRLPGGLLFGQAEQLIHSLLQTGRMAGMSVTIFNPKLDRTGRIAQNIAESMGRAFARKF